VTRIIDLYRGTGVLRQYSDAVYVQEFRSCSGVLSYTSGTGLQTCRSSTGVQL